MCIFPVSHGTVLGGSVPSNCSRCFIFLVERPGNSRLLKKSMAHSNLYFFHLNLGRVVVSYRVFAH